LNKNVSSHETRAVAAAPKVTAAFAWQACRPYLACPKKSWDLLASSSWEKNQWKLLRADVGLFRQCCGRRAGLAATSTRPLYPSHMRSPKFSPLPPPLPKVSERVWKWDTIFKKDTILVSPRRWFTAQPRPAAFPGSIFVSHYILNHLQFAHSVLEASKQIFAMITYIGQWK